MSRIRQAFNRKKAFIAFLTAGDPCLEMTEEFILQMEAAGADLVEIGIPFSDPIAEGPVIQEANIRALSAGTTTDKIFDMTASLRRKTQIPLVFMTYLNPVHYYGYQAFFEKCKETGIDGIIIPDLPYEERGEVADIAASCGVDLVSMIAPTSEQRIREIASGAAGFLYIVSSMGVTGIRSDITTDLHGIMQLVKENAEIPAAIGFGINTPAQSARMAEIADGVIVGSAIVRIIARYGKEAGPYLQEYVKSMKEPIAYPV